MAIPCSVLVKDETELLGINTRVELAFADKILRARKARELMLDGVTIENPDSVTIDAQVQIAPDTVIESNVQLRGRTRIGDGCRIGTGSVLRSCEIGDDVNFLPLRRGRSVHHSGQSIGWPLLPPAHECRRRRRFAHRQLRGVEENQLGAGAKASHLTYLGDATIGAAANIGAGTITCNYDGEKKHQTVIGEGAFVGSNSTLVAPLTIGAGAYTAAGSVITKDVEPDALAIGRARQEDKPLWARRRRQAREPQLTQS